jgi:hypothetical protein
MFLVGYLCLLEHCPAFSRLVFIHSFDNLTHVSPAGDTSSKSHMSWDGRDMGAMYIGEWEGHLMGWESPHMCHECRGKESRQAMAVLEGMASLRG